MLRKIAADLEGRNELLCTAARANAVHGICLGVPKTNLQLANMLHQNWSS